MSLNRYSVDYKTHSEMRQLRKQVEDFESGERYQKLKNEYEKKLAAKDRQIEQIQSKFDRLDQKHQLLLSSI